jgi:altronate hydrolase
MSLPVINGYLRPDGRKGIRNSLLVVYLVECAHHVAREITYPYRDRGAQLIGFGGCYPNAYSLRILTELCTHPNVGGVVLISLGCEGFDKRTLLASIRKSGRPADLFIIQQEGGTSRTIREGRAKVVEILDKIADGPRVEMTAADLIFGTVCGGSDGTSGITANPGVGLCFDRLINAGGTAIFEETGELIGCEHIMASRAKTPTLAVELEKCVAKAAVYYAKMGHGSFSPGNADGGLTTQEEKSMGAYAKSGSSAISGIIKPGDIPRKKGLYLLDVVPDGEPQFGFPNINDSAEIAELIACGSHLVLFATGRGSVVGSVISPVIKVCANPETYRNMEEDMDVDAGRILEGNGSLEEVGLEIYEKTLRVAAGEPTKSELLGHQEFVLTYKSFEPVGPGCFPQ